MAAASRPGGRLLSDHGEIDDVEGQEWSERSAGELAAMPNVRLMTRTSVFGVYDGGIYGALERVSDHLASPAGHQVRQRIWRIVAKHCVLAAGAIERPVVFPGNDRPGVMMASAVRTYMTRFAVTPARRLAVFTNNENGWKTVEAALRDGIEVAAIVNARAEIADKHRTMADSGSRPD